MDKFERHIKKVEASLKKQEKQLDTILAAEEKYKKDNNLSNIILFWERIWSREGLLFDSMKWTFRLPDLYIKAKRYDDALKILDRITGSIYIEKVQKYREKIFKKLK